MVWIAALGVGVLAAAVMGLVVPRVRIDDDEAPDFAQLVSRASVVGVGVAGLVVTQVLWLLPPWAWWLWLPYLGVGVAMAYVDWRTTFLPRVMNWLALGLMVVGAAALAASGEWRALGGAALGALGAFGLLYLAWRLSPGLGFGDVRLALLIGAVAGQGGVSMWTASLFLGTVIGAVHAIVHAAWARRAAGRPAYFAYGPALWLGPVAGALALSVGG